MEVAAPGSVSGHDQLRRANAGRVVSLRGQANSDGAAYGCLCAASQVAPAIASRLAAHSTATSLPLRDVRLARTQVAIRRRVAPDHLSRATSETRLEGPG